MHHFDVEAGVYSLSEKSRFSAQRGPASSNTPPTHLPNCMTLCATLLLNMLIFHNWIQGLSLKITSAFTRTLRGSIDYTILLAMQLKHLHSLILYPQALTPYLHFPNSMKIGEELILFLTGIVLDGLPC
jgi:hypothetical protein